MGGDGREDRVGGILQHKRGVKRGWDGQGRVPDNGGQNRQQDHRSQVVRGVLLTLDAAPPTPGIESPDLVPSLVAKAAHWAMVPLAAAEILAPLARADGAAVSGLGVGGLGLRVWSLGFGGEG